MSGQLDGSQRPGAPERACTARHCRTVSQTSHPKPFDKAAQAFFDLGLGIVVEPFARLGNVGERLRNIAWLWRLSIDDRVCVEFLLEEGD
jgi:hypothetical protein